MRENREVPWSPIVVMVGTGREGNADGGNPLMHEHGKSHGPVVPTKLPNNAALAVAEVAHASVLGRTRILLRAAPPAASSGSNSSTRNPTR